MSPTYVCPVCGFDGLGEPPFDKAGCPSYEVCARCGFEFGFDAWEDRDRYREEWIKKGSPWFDRRAAPRCGDSGGQ